jgi:hypothetical protein
MAQLIWEDNSRVEIKILLAQSKAEKIMSLRSCGSASDLILIPRRRKDTVNVERDDHTNRYEFDKPGEYSIQIERELPESLGGGVIKSNAITVTVTP